MIDPKERVEKYSFDKCSYRVIKEDGRTMSILTAFDRTFTITYVATEDEVVVTISRDTPIGRHGWINERHIALSFLRFVSDVRIEQVITAVSRFRMENVRMGTYTDNSTAYSYTDTFCNVHFEHDHIIKHRTDSFELLQELVAK